MAKLKLDLHDIYNHGDKIEAELNRIVQEAVDRRIELVEIIPGKPVIGLEIPNQHCARLSIDAKC